MKETLKTKEAELAGAGQKLFAHSKSAEFTARRGLVMELWPFIYGASERMSSKAISNFLEKEQGVKLSSVSINKALKDSTKSWNAFFDAIEEPARIFAKDDGVSMKDLLFKKQYFYESFKNPLLQAAAKALVKKEVVHAAGVLRTKWFVIDYEIRLKALPFLEHRLDEKGKK
ncbi:MAG: hypothetical protein ACREDS_14265 [Limisphaerales bacterium]